MRGETDRAALLREASTTLRVMMRPDALRRAEPDVAALLEAEGIAMRPGPRSVIAAGPPTLRRTILGMQLVVVRYAGPDADEPNTRILCPYGILYGGRGWLVAHADELPDHSRRLFRRYPTGARCARRLQGVNIEQPAFSAVADRRQAEGIGDGDPGFAIRSLATQLHVRCWHVIANFAPLPELAGGPVAGFDLRSRQHAVEIVFLAACFRPEMLRQTFERLEQAICEKALRISVRP